VNQPANQVVCNNSQTTQVVFTTGNAGGTTTYTWTNDKPSIGLAADGSGDILTFIAHNTGTEPVVATIVVTPHFTNASVACDGPTKSFTITVNPTGQVNQPASQVVCNNSQTTQVVFTTGNTGGATTYTWTNDKPSIGLAASGSGNVGAFNAINTGTSPAVATITVTPHFTNASVTCDGPTKNFTITVNPTGQVNQPASQVVCDNSQTTQVVFTTGNTGGATTYTWTNDQPSIGLASSGSGNISAFNAVNTGTSPVVATIVVTPHFTNASVACDGPTKSFTITVNPTGQVNQPADQVVCNNTQTTQVVFTTGNTGGATTYTWTNDQPSIGLTSSGSGNISAFNAVNTGTSPVVATITVTPHYTSSSITCDGATKNFTITVNPTGQMNQPASQVVCNNSQTTQVVFSTGNTGGVTTYTWTNNQPSIGLTSSGSGNISAFNAVNTGTSPVVATITVTPHYTSSSITCDGATKNFTITVNPTGQVNQPASQVVCNNSQTTQVVFTTGNTGGVTTYTWTNNLTTIGLAASGSGDIPAFTALNGGGSPRIATITVTPHYTNESVTCDGPTESFTITVNPTAQVYQPADQVLCNGALTNPVVFTTNRTGGISTYTWTNDQPGIGLATSGSGDIAAFTAINSGTAPVVATIFVTPHFTNESVACDGPAKSFTITVNPTGQVNDPADQVVCNGFPTTTVIFTTGNTGGTTTYTWINSTASIGLAMSGTGNIPSFTAINSGFSPVVATITVTPHYNNASVTCDGPTESFTITINPTAQVYKPADQVLCNGTLTNPVVFTTNRTGGISTYTWTNDQPGIGLAASGSGDIAAFTAVNSGTAPVVATIFVTPHFNNESVTCDGPTQSFTITVNPTGQVNDPADLVVCNNTQTTQVVFTTGNTGGVTTYTWTNNLTTIGLAASGSGDIPPFTALNGGGSPRIATITVTPHFTSGAITCDGPTKNFTITVNPTAQVYKPADQVLCNGVLTNPVVFTTDRTGGISTYTWTNDMPSIGLAASGSGNISAFNATNTGTSPVVATITVTPHYTSGSITCDGPTKNFTITVNPTAQVNDPADQVVCNNGQSTQVVFTTGNTGGTTTYTWTNDKPSIGLAASGSGNIGAFNAVNTGTSPAVATITVTPQYTSSSITCDGATKNFTITVNPTGQVNQPADQVVCNGFATTSVNFTTGNTGGVTTYTWTNDNPSIGLAADGSGDILTFITHNTGTEPVVATIVVTPHYTSGSLTCDGPTKIFTITVNPTAQVNDPANQVVCNGFATTTVNFTTGNAGGVTTYTWTNDKPSIGLTTDGSGDILTFIAHNTGMEPVVATIVVTPHFNNESVTCDGPTQSFTITVNPTGQVNQPASQVVCNNTQTTQVVFTTGNAGGATTYTWTNDNPSIGLAADGSGDIPTFITHNTGTEPVVATIMVTPHYTSESITCDGPTKIFTITVNPTGQVNQPADQVVCNNTQTTQVVFTTGNAGGATTYTWTNDNPSIGLAADGSGDILTFIAHNTGTEPVVATIVVTPHYTSESITCDGPTKIFTITVNPAGQVNDPADQVVCINSQTTQVVFTTGNAGGTTTYTWTNDKPGIGLAASGSGNIDPFTVIVTATSPIIATITVTPHFSNESITCDGPTESSTITGNPMAHVYKPANQVLCNGAMTIPVEFTTRTSGGTATYSWTNDNAGIGLAASGSGDIAAFTAINSGTEPVVATIQIYPYFTNDGVTCTGNVKIFTITVNPTGQVNQPASQVVCNNSQTTQVVFTTGNTGGVTTYTWTNDKPSIGLASSGSGDIGAFNATNTGTSPVVATIIVTPHFTNASVTCDGPTKSFIITVNPTGQVNQPANQVVCNNTQTTQVVFTTGNTDGTTSYTWTNDKTSIGLASSGSGNISAFNAINTGTSPVVATITVTPHYTSGSITCDGPTKNFTITVNPTGQVNQPGNQAICHNSSTTNIIFTTQNTGGTTTYTWTNNQPGIGLAASGTGNINAFTVINTGTAPIVATIVVTPHFTNGSITCDGPTKNFTITANPLKPVSITIQASETTVCALTNVTYTSNVINGGTAPQYQWKVNGMGVTGATNSNYTYAPLNNDVITCVVTSNATCATGNPALSNSITMTVIPLTPVSVTITANYNPVGTGVPVTFTAVAQNGGSSPTYQWKVNGNIVGTGATSYTYNPANNDNVTCTLTSSLTGCLSGNPVVSNIIVMLVAAQGGACPGTETITYGSKTYNTVQIGTQCWFRENLDIGNMLVNPANPSNNSIIEKYCYNNLTSNCDIYGGLYKWDEMMAYSTTEGAQGICPTGWHIPTDAQLTTLSTFLGGNTVAGGKLKETGFVHWKYSAGGGATNSSGFTGLPGGSLYSGVFAYLTENGYFASSKTHETNSAWTWSRSLSYYTTTFGRIAGYKTTGISVRCLKN